MNIYVTKRDGRKEQFDINKIHKVVEWACEGVDNVSVSTLELNARMQFFDGIKTEDIHNLLIKSAHDLISVNNHEYDTVAMRLLNFHLRKKVYKNINPLPLETVMRINTEAGIYDPDLYESFMELPQEQREFINSYIDHNRDYSFTYAGLQQLADKYLLSDKKTGQLFETPQIMYMMIAYTSSMVHYSKPDFHRIVTDLYDAFSNFSINLPTPVMGGVRTKLKQYSSCVLIEAGDSIDSIFAAVTAVGKYSAERAGIGLNIGRVRAVNTPIRNSEVISTGIIPFLKIFESTVKSTTQNGIRGGSMAVSLPVWHSEILNFIKLKDQAGTEETRVRKLDYTIVYNDMFIERLKNNENMTLFSASEKEVPGLFDAYHDAGKFRILYERYEKDPHIPKTSVPARKIFTEFLIQRLNVGQIYWMNIDEVNRHGSFLLPVNQTQLCTEVMLPVKYFKNHLDPDARIGVCILGAINVGNISSIYDLEDIVYKQVEFLDNLITIQSYPLPGARDFTESFRPLGIGIINFAYYLAKKGIRSESREAVTEMHNLMEAVQYFSILASIKLAQKRGPAEKFEYTKYSKGILPIDTYNRNTDGIHDAVLNFDWDRLRDMIKASGMRHTALTAQPPTQSSALVSGSIGAFYPPQSPVTYHKSKKGLIKQLVPDVKNLKDVYSYAFSMESGNKYLIETAAVMQKFMDQGISMNLYYDYTKYKDYKIPLSELANDLLYAHNLGLKTIYYNVTNDGNIQDISAADGKGCESGACEV